MKLKDFLMSDEVRAIICPDKISTAQWLQVMEAAHAVGLRSTATIMFGHVDGYPSGAVKGCGEEAHRRQNETTKR